MRQRVAEVMETEEELLGEEYASYDRRWKFG